MPAIPLYSGASVFVARMAMPGVSSDVRTRSENLALAGDNFPQRSPQVGLSRNLNGEQPIVRFFRRIQESQRQVYDQ